MTERKEGAYPFLFKQPVFLYLFFHYIHLIYSERGPGVHSNDTYLFLGRSLLKLRLQAVYFFQKVVITPRGAVISATQLTLLS